MPYKTSSPLEKELEKMETLKMKKQEEKPKKEFDPT
jgi:hypothetical protein